MTVFFRVLNSSAEAKSDILHKLIGDMSRDDVFVVKPETFSMIPGAPFAYWVSPQIRDVFRRLPAYETGDRTVRVGLQTSDDFRFVRLGWEIALKGLDKVWFPIVKGGSFSRYYADINTLVNWSVEGREIKAFAETTPGTTHWSRNIRNVEYYLQPGITWPLRGVHFSAQAVPSGCIFSIGGKMAFAGSNELPAFLAVFNTVPFDYILCLSAGKVGGVQYEVGLVQKTPVPSLASPEIDVLGKLGSRAWALQRMRYSVQETSHAFVLPWLLRPKASAFEPAAIEAELLTIEKQVEEWAFSLYGLAHEDRREIERWAGNASTALPIDADDFNDVEGESAPTQEAAESHEGALISWAAGVAFGRFDIRLAIGERQAPPEPEPFDPLPVRIPGMIPEADEAQFPPRPLLVDDPGHALDLTVQAGSVLERVGFPLENPEILRHWLARDFFPLHIKMYSKSRRKAPIYWQLATPSARYSVWLYIHAFTRDTLFKVQNDYVTPKLALEEGQLESFRTEIGDNPTAAERKELAARESFVEELRAFLDEVRRVAPLWNPDLDDGVIINFAPLWRLVPHHKPWQKELKATWDALCSEEYDWSHLAMHLWPERVVPKCATDRSLAIAHGLEDVFWLEGEDGKWRPRPIPARPVNEIVAERTSPAVKAALKNLLEAPSVTGGGGRGRPRGRRGGAA